MGWDAYGVRPGIDPATSSEEWLTSPLVEAFRHASEELASITGSGSDNLGSGTLGGLSMGILERATSIPDYDPANEDGQLLWSPETVNRANRMARWDFPMESEWDSFLVEEARLFLRVCASRGMSIWFSW